MTRPVSGTASTAQLVRRLQAIKASEPRGNGLPRTRVPKVLIGPVQKGALRGYKLHYPAAERRRFLAHDVSFSGYTKTARRLVALKTFNNNNLAHRAIVTRDLNWLRKTYR